MNSSKKIALITGIGLVVNLALFKANYSVVMTGRRPLASVWRLQVGSHELVEATDRFRN